MRQMLSFLVFLGLLSLGFCHGRLPALGESCNGQIFRPRMCSDEPMNVMETTGPADQMNFGPNVCMTERTETVNASDYVVDQSCRRSFFGNLCWRNCVRAETCSVRNMTRRSYDCCEGFASRGSGRDHGFGFGFIRHPGFRLLRREGCPIALKASVAECLEELELTGIRDAIGSRGLSSLLTDTDEELTVFAPVNDALENQFVSQRILNSHILAGDIVRNCDLRNGAVLRPLEESTLLHVTDVYKYSDMEFTETTFINGAEVNTSDACLAENGVVHILKSLIPSSPDSIVEMLSSEAQFSDFVQLLAATNISRFLGPNRNTSRTVFAPTNDAFGNLPDGALECLLRPENLRLTRKLVLLHITAPAEYTSSLALRSRIRTFHPRYSLYVRVIDGAIHLSQNNVTLLETNITARNGVVHSLGDVLLGGSINFDNLCPPPSPEIPVPVQPPVPDSGDQPLTPPSNGPDIVG